MIPTPKITLKWIAYNLLLGYALYWTSNLILWYPWSINPILGISLMLTIGPLLWGYGSYLSLTRGAFKRKWLNPIINALVFLLVAVISDYVFFGIIRGAMEELYHPTTFYGYGFLLSLPFLLMLIFGKKMKNNPRTVSIKDYIIHLALGSLSLIAIILIIKFNLSY